MLAFTGASGMPYGLRLLECLLAADSPRVARYYAGGTDRREAGMRSRPVRRNRAKQRGFSAHASERARASSRFSAYDDWNAPAASGSNPADAMAICPCTMGALGAIAGGLADNLIERAADVMLKERRPLVLVPRETPLSAIHLENMLKLARAGAAIVPPVPGFYDRPESIGDLVDFVVARILDQLGVAHRLGPRWGENRARDSSAGRGRHDVAVFRRRAASAGGRASAVSAEDGAVSRRRPPAADLRAALHRDGEDMPQGRAALRRLPHHQGRRSRPGDASRPAFAPVGTLATRCRWDMPQLGILHVTAFGSERFQLQTHDVKADGLVVAAWRGFRPSPWLRLRALPPLVTLLECWRRASDRTNFRKRPRTTTRPGSAIGSPNSCRCRCRSSRACSRSTTPTCGFRLLQKFLRQQGLA